MYNRNFNLPLGQEAEQVFQNYQGNGENIFVKEGGELLFKLLLDYDMLKESFRNISDSLISNGDLAEKLLAYRKTNARQTKDFSSSAVLEEVFQSARCRLA